MWSDGGNLVRKPHLSVLEEGIRRHVLTCYFVRVHIHTRRSTIARRIDNSNQLIDKLLCLKRMSSGLWVIIISALCAGLVSRAANGLELTEFILTVLVLALLDGATGLRSIWLLLVLVLQECRGRTHIVTMHR